jgi:hypothetical protein
MAPKSGVPEGGAPTVLATGQATPSGVALDSTSLYFTSEVGAGAVLVLALGGSGMPGPFVSNQAYANAIVVDATNVYWTNFSSNGSVMQVAK